MNHDYLTTATIDPFTRPQRSRMEHFAGIAALVSLNMSDAELRFASFVAMETARDTGRPFIVINAEGRPDRAFFEALEIDEARMRARFQEMFGIPYEKKPLDPPIPVKVYGVSQNWSMERQQAFDRLSELTKEQLRDWMGDNALIVGTDTMEKGLVFVLDHIMATEKLGPPSMSFEDIGKMIAEPMTLGPNPFLPTAKEAEHAAKVPHWKRKHGVSNVPFYETVPRRKNKRK